jgi:hypothetical protein
MAALMAAMGRVQRFLVAQEPLILELAAVVVIQLWVLTMAAQVLLFLDYIRKVNDE